MSTLSYSAIMTERSQRGRELTAVTTAPPKFRIRQLNFWYYTKHTLHDISLVIADCSALALSGGQQQRLCIARALATDPEVLLLDEPASALDPASTARIEDLIFELRREYTIIIVTHNMQQAARVSDRTAFFFQGYMVEEG